MIDHFSHGLMTPVIAYAVSVIGSFIGLTAATRARAATTSASRWMWLVLSAVCLGGTAVWSMHFIAMMGFRVSGTPIRYDAGLTIASGLLAIGVMGVALYLTIRRQTNMWLLVSGGIAGIGIVSMHYMGMASMNMHGEMQHNPLFVAAAIAIALAAATVALWFAWRLNGAVAILAASLLMGVAVSAMHYVGMMGVSVELEGHNHAQMPPGSASSDLLLPLVVGLFVFLLVASLFLMLGVDDNADRARKGSGRGADRRTAGASAAASSAGDDGYTARHGSVDNWKRP
ncbi:MHYT domain-containing protein [Nocardiopsis algeriensis]|uniref:NO-binding membrane sensor protein with MHYT domain n=1 Tax=Nocardiopsis algeriensis TaxID=1478215 RepID=A0A841IPB6_9ACTN|nr:MHYT domain-containing protein [Nocardiopsis algeriensis]MBB6118108.1 NO-binding membrane sensor protein with MHYT domain [Nocardiopsis algeriensis]